MNNKLPLGLAAIGLVLWGASPALADMLPPPTSWLHRNDLFSPGRLAVSGLAMSAALASVILLKRGNRVLRGLVIAFLGLVILLAVGVLLANSHRPPRVREPYLHERFPYIDHIPNESQLLFPADW